jgi:F0F1-type ATP synthase membrane subunit b/b'
MLLLAFLYLPEWVNYPGFELWRFVNLAIFIVLGIYFLRSKISQKLSVRGEVIRQELLAAETERERAQAKLAEADSMLSRVDEDVRTVHEQAQAEAKAERERLAAATDREIEKLKQQGRREMETAAKVARKELRRYFAQRSVEFARESIRHRMRPEDDTALIRENIGDLRRTTV